MKEFKHVPRVLTVVFVSLLLMGSGFGSDPKEDGPQLIITGPEVQELGVYAYEVSPGETPSIRMLSDTGYEVGRISVVDDQLQVGFNNNSDPAEFTANLGTALGLERILADDQLDPFLSPYFATESNDDGATIARCHSICARLCWRTWFGSLCASICYHRC